jgi:hypothetical protein
MDKNNSSPSYTNKFFSIVDSPASLKALDTRLEYEIKTLWQKELKENTIN